MESSYKHLQKVNEEISGQSRAETGPLQVGNDWPGVFIRGDDALGHSFNLHQFLDMLEKRGSLSAFTKEDEQILQFTSLSSIRILANLLSSCYNDNFNEDQT